MVGYLPSGYDPCRQESQQQVNNHQLSGYTGTRPRTGLGGCIWWCAHQKRKWISWVLKFLGEATAPQFCTHALRIFVKETQTLKIMPIAGNKDDVEKKTLCFILSYITQLIL